ncbi:predicted protein [Aspergillus terreus NIH2624]|uniref:N-acetyltransferase domain-containing protein n=1 Tax=Aspergillus terreus (strain NIH 2624 / FGSC A1156) TaxID=341663 RepID=Q0CZN4_ASPTN|nr:uncharacterized protein ATEG_00850 [Aspergillus terreus NIH2624]EAU39496.1 predicted protein [Aspergillus terreus NIH2624]
MSSSDGNEDVVVHTGRSGNKKRAQPQPRQGRPYGRGLPFRPESNVPSTPTSDATRQATPQTPRTHKANGRPNGQEQGSPKDSSRDSKQARKDELKQLQQEIVANAHLNRFKEFDHTVASPEVLATCRTGAGTDPSSKIYQQITRCRLAAKSDLGKRNDDSSASASLPADATEEQRLAAPWSTYEISARVYPVVVDNKLSLSTEPTAEYERFKIQVDTIIQDVSPSTQAPLKSSWKDAFRVNWEDRPQICSPLGGFRDWFRRWLDTTVTVCCYVDTYHDKFFDGTAHPDGVRSLFIPSFEDHPTRLNNDEKSQLHQCETAEGYCYNWTAYVREEKNRENERKEMERNAYLEAMKSPISNPNSPKANVYLRPVEPTDVPQLLEIFNWYAHRSPLSPYLLSLDESEVRQRIDDCRSEKLPFIVAVERKLGHARDGTPEKILGYALATDFLGVGSAATTGRFTAELQLFVKQGHKRLRIGSCLMDKLLEVCDPTHIPKLGYFFDASLEERSGYEPGGRRKLARLVFIVSYPAGESSGYKWLMEWLRTRYDFEEQGVIKGGGVKFDHFYLVRSIGYSRDGRADF